MVATSLCPGPVLLGVYAPGQCVSVGRRVGGGSGSRDAPFEEWKRLGQGPSAQPATPCTKEVACCLIWHSLDRARLALSYTPNKTR